MFEGTSTTTHVPVSTLAPVITRSYARQVNNRYKNGTSIYLSLKDRWNSTIAALDVHHKNSINSRLKLLSNQFRSRYPGVRSLNDPDFRLCRALRCRLSNLLIDSTIQRQLDVEWVLTILERFVTNQVMPVQVYRVPTDQVPAEYQNGGDFYACWDSQHTAVVLWIINHIFLGNVTDSEEVPMVEYDIADRQECRMTFINNNSKEGKKLLEPIDKVVQMIYAVELDNADIPEWVQVHEKQKHLAAHDLFLTSSKFYDDDEPGAITRVKDVADVNVSVEIVRQFTVYANRVLAVTNRAINTKELPIVLGFLKMASQGNVVYTDSEIESLADLCIAQFRADFDEDGKFWHQVGVAYTKWHNRQYREYDETIRPGIRLNKDWTQGGTFFYFQLYFTWLNDQGERMRLPKLNINTPFLPSKSDVFK